MFEEDPCDESESSEDAPNSVPKNPLTMIFGRLQLSSLMTIDHTRIHEA